MNSKGHKNDKYCEFHLSADAGCFEDKFVTITERTEYTGSTITSDSRFYEQRARSKKGHQAGTVAG